MSRSDTRRGLLANAWAQMFLVLIIVVLANTWSSHRFFRADLTSDGIHSLHLATRTLAHRLDKPLTAKVYFTEDLKAPAHNHRQIVIDMLEELQAYSRGQIDIQVVDPTDDEALQSEARRFGVEAIEESFSSASLKQSRKVYMGLALVSGDRQQTLPAIRQTATLEYDLARALKRIVSQGDRKRVGFTQGHGELDLSKGKAYQAKIRDGVSENVDLVPVTLGGSSGVPEDIDGLLVLGPTKVMDDRSLYQLDQFLMRGGALAYFVTNLRGDVRSGRARGVAHGMDDLLAHYGVTVNKDVVLDRKMNGVMHFPVPQGRYTLNLPLNYALMPRSTDLARNSPIVGPLKGLMFPFASSLTLADPMLDEVELTVLATASPTAARVDRLPTINPRGLAKPLPGEEAGSWPLMVSMRGTWSSFFAGREIPPPSRPTGTKVQDDPRSKLVESIQTRMVVVGSLDFVGNNVGAMLNLVDWLVQDISLIGIRSKTATAAPLTPPDESDARWLRALNLVGGSTVLLLFGLLRRGMRGRTRSTWTKKKSGSREMVLEEAGRLRNDLPDGAGGQGTDPQMPPIPPGPTVEERARAALATDRAPRAPAAPPEPDPVAASDSPDSGGVPSGAAARYGAQAAESGADADLPDPWAEEAPDPWGDEAPDPWAEDAPDAPDASDSPDGDEPVPDGPADPWAESVPAPPEEPKERMSWSLADEVPEVEEEAEEEVDEAARERSRQRAVEAREAMAQLREIEARHAKAKAERQSRVNAGVTFDDEPEEEVPEVEIEIAPAGDVEMTVDESDSEQAQGTKKSQISVLQAMAIKKAESKKAESKKAESKKAAPKKAAPKKAAPKKAAKKKAAPKKAAPKKAAPKKAAKKKAAPKKAAKKKGDEA